MTRINKIGYCYCCGKFGELHDVCTREICTECFKLDKICTNIINNILRKEGIKHVNKKSGTVSD